MNIDLVDLGAIVLLVVPLVVLLACLFADPIELDLDAPARVLDWPLGVQEEEPIRWRVDALTPRNRRESSGAAASDGRPRVIDRRQRRMSSKPVR